MGNKTSTRNVAAAGETIANGVHIIINWRLPFVVVVRAGE